MRSFLQIGASRDGTDPYRVAAQRRNFSTILVETQEYLTYRKELGRVPYDCEIAVGHPENADAVIDALTAAGESPELVLSGFETYTPSAYSVARFFAAEPAISSGDFHPIDKWGQRTRIERFSPHVAQPIWTLFEPRMPLQTTIARIGFPLVVKPANGAAGLGVTLVQTREELLTAIAALEHLRNYGDSDFSGILLEQYVQGPEHSVQGLVRNGTVEVFSVCEKIVFLEKKNDLVGFREAGHIACSPADAPRGILEMTNSVIASVGYRNGPFHIDCVERGGRYYYLEMGFRLSGMGITRMIERMTNRNLGDESFAAHIGEAHKTRTKSNLTVGQITLASPDELEIALGMSGPLNIEVERFTTPMPSNSILIAPALRTDFLRFNGSVGRALVSGSDYGFVRDALVTITSGRSVFGRKPCGTREAPTFSTSLAFGPLA
ncbi:MAG TPA: ATP-grasp domain-containing protein [Candidatus Baltobacteraceae bacterium]|nr:ATP-grasp domain-containing protein [Candidatus Baltobacteraceae bacterium]